MKELVYVRRFAVFLNLSYLTPETNENEVQHED